MDMGEEIQEKNEDKDDDGNASAAVLEEPQVNDKVDESDEKLIDEIRDVIVEEKEIKKEEKEDKELEWGNDEDIERDEGHQIENQGWDMKTPNQAALAQATSDDESIDDSDSDDSFDFADGLSIVVIITTVLSMLLILSYVVYKTNRRYQAEDDERQMLKSLLDSEMIYGVE